MAGAPDEVPAAHAGWPQVNRFSTPTCSLATQICSLPGSPVSQRSHQLGKDTALSSVNSTAVRSQPPHARSCDTSFTLLVAAPGPGPAHRTAGKDDCLHPIRPGRDCSTPTLASSWGPGPGEPHTEEENTWFSRLWGCWLPGAGPGPAAHAEEAGMLSGPDSFPLPV